MSRLHLFFMVLVCLLLYQCRSERNVTYSIPSDYPEARRQQIIEIFEKGKVLYKMNCSQCHGIFTKGRDSIPNFSEVQFDNYSTRFMSGDPLNHAVARKMSPEQLNQILMFLRYKKHKDTANSPVSGN